ncbi:MAG: hypothetical protein HZT41_15040 [Dechloromonas sp.]|nr:MAG: hypothetical protein HZT41_15040 [Dechloromonas sp.]
MASATIPLVLAREREARAGDIAPCPPAMFANLRHLSHHAAWCRRRAVAPH